MNILISGGCKNGKSMYAQTLAKAMAQNNETELYYIATMRPSDEEDLARIARHIDERKGWGFTTLEQPEGICDCLKKAKPDGAFLMDSVTALLSNEMFSADGTFDETASERVAEQLMEFAENTGNTIFVSDYIYEDAGLYDQWTEAYRKGLAHIDKTLAKVCQRVIEVVAGNIIEYKEF